MRVGIYNRWLHTIGGGERYTLSLAEYLAQTHDVEVFGHERVERAVLEDKLDVDLSRVTLRFLPGLPEEELSEYTSRFDLFINATFQSFLVPRAARSLLIVYFPSPLVPSASRRLRRRLALIARRTMLVPELVEGFYPPDRFQGIEFRWTGTRARIRIAGPHRRQSLRVELALGRPLGDAVAGTDVVCSVNGKHVKTVHVRPTRPVFAWEELTLDNLHDGVADLGLNVLEPVERDGRRVGVAILDTRVHHLRHWPYRVLFRRMFPRLGYRLAAVHKSPADLRRALGSYQVICAISGYARTWIDRYWGIPCLLLPPPAPVERLAPGDKKRQILSVGRFFRGSHNKKHREMIQVFKELQRQGHLAGWELHLAGTVTPGAAHEAYLAEVQAAAAGAPVHIHTGIAFEGLCRLYAESQVYWHACGYSEDEKREPEKFEHFGITTVEAMAAGCVPIVIAKGGQTEIVRHGVDGFLWRDFEELKRLTLRVSEDDSLARRLAAQAVERSRIFGTEAFRRRLDEIIETL